MRSELPPKTLSALMTQWFTRFDNQLKKIAMEEKITTMKLASKTNYYIQHVDIGTLPTKDKRRFIIYQYIHLQDFIEHLKKDQPNINDIHHALERTKAGFIDLAGKHPSLSKTKAMLIEFQTELHHFVIAQKKAEPDDQFKR